MSLVLLARSGSDAHEILKKMIKTDTITAPASYRVDEREKLSNCSQLECVLTVQCAGLQPMGVLKTKKILLNLHSIHKQ